MSHRPVKTPSSETGGKTTRKSPSPTADVHRKSPPIPGSKHVEETKKTHAPREAEVGSVRRTEASTSSRDSAGGVVLTDVASYKPKAPALNSRTESSMSRKLILKSPKQEVWRTPQGTLKVDALEVLKKRAPGSIMPKPVLEGAIKIDMAAVLKSRNSGKNGSSVSKRGIINSPTKRSPVASRSRSQTSQLSDMSSCHVNQVTSTSSKRSEKNKPIAQQKMSSPKRSSNQLKVSPVQNVAEHQSSIPVQNVAEHQSSIPVQNVAEHQSSIPVQNVAEHQSSIPDASMMVSHAISPTLMVIDTRTPKQAGKALEMESAISSKRKFYLPSSVPSQLVSKSSSFTSSSASPLSNLPSPPPVPVRQEVPNKRPSPLPRQLRSPEIGSTKKPHLMACDRERPLSEPTPSRRSSTSSSPSTVGAYDTPRKALTSVSNDRNLSSSLSSSSTSSVNEPPQVKVKPATSNQMLQLLKTDSQESDKRIRKEKRHKESKQMRNKKKAAAEAAAAVEAEAAAAVEAEAAAAVEAEEAAAVEAEEAAAEAAEEAAAEAAAAEAAAAEAAAAEAVAAVEAAAEAAAAEAAAAEAATVVEAEEAAAVSMNNKRSFSTSPCFSGAEDEQSPAKMKESKRVSGTCPISPMQSTTRKEQHLIIQYAESNIRSASLVSPQLEDSRRLIISCSPVLSDDVISAVRSHLPCHTDSDSQIHQRPATADSKTGASANAAVRKKRLTDKQEIQPAELEKLTSKIVGTAQYLVQKTCRTLSSVASKTETRSSSSTTNSKMNNSVTTSVSVDVQKQTSDNILQRIKSTAASSEYSQMTIMQKGISISSMTEEMKNMSLSFSKQSSVSKDAFPLTPTNQDFQLQQQQVQQQVQLQAQRQQLEMQQNQQMQLLQQQWQKFQIEQIRHQKKAKLPAAKSIVNEATQVLKGKFHNIAESVFTATESATPLPSVIQTIKDILIWPSSTGTPLNSATRITSEVSPQLTLEMNTQTANQTSVATPSLIESFKEILLTKDTSLSPKSSRQRENLDQETPLLISKLSSSKLSSKTQPSSSSPRKTMKIIKAKKPIPTADIGSSKTGGKNWSKFTESIEKLEVNAGEKYLSRSDKSRQLETYSDYVDSLSDDNLHWTKSEERRSNVTGTTTGSARRHGEKSRRLRNSLLYDGMSSQGNEIADDVNSLVLKSSLEEILSRPVEDQWPEEHFSGRSQVHQSRSSLPKNTATKPSTDVDQERISISPRRRSNSKSKEDYSDLAFRGYPSDNNPSDPETTQIASNASQSRSDSSNVFGQYQFDETPSTSRHYKSKPTTDSLLDALKKNHHADLEVLRANPEELEVPGQSSRPMPRDEPRRRRDPVERPAEDFTSAIRMSGSLLDMYMKKLEEETSDPKNIGQSRRPCSSRTKESEVPIDETILEDIEHSAIEQDEDLMWKRKSRMLAEKLMEAISSLGSYQTISGTNILQKKFPNRRGIDKLEMNTSTQTLEDSEMPINRQFKYSVDSEELARNLVTISLQKEQDVGMSEIPVNNSRVPVEKRKPESPVSSYNKVNEHRAPPKSIKPIKSPDEIAAQYKEDKQRKSHIPGTEQPVAAERSSWKQKNSSKQQNTTLKREMLTAKYEDPSPSGSHDDNLTEILSAIRPRIRARILSTSPTLLNQRPERSREEAFAPSADGTQPIRKKGEQIDYQMDDMNRQNSEPYRTKKNNAEVDQKDRKYKQLPSKMSARYKGVQCDLDGRVSEDGKRVPYDRKDSKGRQNFTHFPDEVSGRGGKPAVSSHERQKTEDKNKKCKENYADGETRVNKGAQLKVQVSDGKRKQVGYWTKEIPAGESELSSGKSKNKGFQVSVRVKDAGKPGDDPNYRMEKIQTSGRYASNDGPRESTNGPDTPVGVDGSAQAAEKVKKNPPLPAARKRHLAAMADVGATSLPKNLAMNKNRRPLGEKSVLVSSEKGGRGNKTDNRETPSPVLNARFQRELPRNELTCMGDVEHFAKLITRMEGSPFSSTTSEDSLMKASVSSPQSSSSSSDEPTVMRSTPPDHQTTTGNRYAVAVLPSQSTTAQMDRHSQNNMVRSLCNLSSSFKRFVNSHRRTSNVETRPGVMPPEDIEEESERFAVAVVTKDSSSHWAPQNLMVKSMDKLSASFWKLVGGKNKQEKSKTLPRSQPSSDRHSCSHQICNDDDLRSLPPYLSEEDDKELEDTTEQKEKSQKAKSRVSIAVLLGEPLPSTMPRTQEATHQSLQHLSNFSRGKFVKEPNAIITNAELFSDTPRTSPESSVPSITNDKENDYKVELEMAQTVEECTLTRRSHFAIAVMVGDKEDNVNHEIAFDKSMEWVSVSYQQKRSKQSASTSTARLKNQTYLSHLEHIGSAKSTEAQEQTFLREPTGSMRSIELPAETFLREPAGSVISLELPAETFLREPTGTVISMEMPAETYLSDPTDSVRRLNTPEDPLLLEPTDSLNAMDHSWENLQARILLEQRDSRDILLCVDDLCDEMLEMLEPTDSVKALREEVVDGRVLEPTDSVKRLHPLTPFGPSGHHDNLPQALPVPDTASTLKCSPVANNEPSAGATAEDQPSVDAEAIKPNAISAEAEETEKPEALEESKEPEKPEALEESKQPEKPEALEESKEPEPFVFVNVGPSLSTKAETIISAVMGASICKDILPIDSFESVQNQPPAGTESHPTPSQSPSSSTKRKRKSHSEGYTVTVIVMEPGKSRNNWQAEDAIEKTLDNLVTSLQKLTTRKRKSSTSNQSAIPQTDSLSINQSTTSSLVEELTRPLLSTADAGNLADDPYRLAMVVLDLPRPESQACAQENSEPNSSTEGNTAATSLLKNNSQTDRKKQFPPGGE